MAAQARSSVRWQRTRMQRSSSREPGGWARSAARSWAASATTSFTMPTFLCWSADTKMTTKSRRGSGGTCVPPPLRLSPSGSTKCHYRTQEISTYLRLCHIFFTCWKIMGEYNSNVAKRQLGKLM